MVLGADVAGAVESVGEGATRFSPGDEVFGQLLNPPLGSAGTYAEYVAVTEDAPLARVPAGIEPAVAAAETGDPNDLHLSAAGVRRAERLVSFWEFANHVRGAVTNGLTPNDLRAVLVQVAIYCGIPIGADCFQVAATTLSDSKAK